MTVKHTSTIKTLPLQEQIEKISMVAKTGKPDKGREAIHVQN